MCLFVQTYSDPFRSIQIRSDLFRPVQSRLDRHRSHNSPQFKKEMLFSIKTLKFKSFECQRKVSLFTVWEMCLFVHPSMIYNRNFLPPNNFPWYWEKKSCSEKDAWQWENVSFSFPSTNYLNETKSRQIIIALDSKSYRKLKNHLRWLKLVSD